MRDFYQKSINKVKEAMHSYWLDKNIDSLLNACENKQVYLIGVTNPNWEGYYVLDGEHYDVVEIDEKSCIICARVALNKCDENKEVLVDASVHCIEKDGNVRFFYLHMTPLDMADDQQLSAFIAQKHKKDSKYREVMHGIFDAVLEYSCLNNTFRYDHNEYRKLFQMDKYFITIDQWFWSFVSECVHPDDADCLDVFRDADIIKRIKKGQNIVEAEFRVKNDVKKYIWVKMILLLIPNDSNSNVKEMYMLFKNIDEEQEELMENKMLARTDDLTLIWNRSYSEQLIRKYLAKIRQPQKNMIMFIDVDDLKNINDTYGRLTGDYILSKIVENVLSVIEPKDVFGRFKQDCFVLFLWDRKGREELEYIVNKVSEVTAFQYVEKQISSQIHCSIGAKIADGGESLPALLKNCETALEEAVKNGGNSYFIM